MSKHKSNTSKYVLIAIFLLFVVVISAFAISSLNEHAQEKRPASQYLRILHTRSVGTFYNGNQTVELKILGLNITAVGGDATDVQLIMDSQADRTNDYFRNITKGITVDMQVQLQGYVTHVNGQGLFPVEFDISCVQTTLSTITFYINPKDIVTL